MIKIEENTDIKALVEQGYYIVCSSDDGFGPGDLCDEYWHLEEAPFSPCGKSIYNYTFNYEDGFDKWYQDYEEWLAFPRAWLDKDECKYACTIDELQEFL